MKIKHFLSSVALLLPLAITAQKSVVPEVKVVNERNANPMVLQDLSVDIFGNRANSRYYYGNDFLQP